MGFFTSILNLTPKAQKYKKQQRSLERRQAWARIESVQRGIAFREKEDPREQAMLKQSAWGRGLGKSSIYDQDKERLSMVQGHRRAALDTEYDMAIRYRKLIKAKHKYERRSQYMEMLDSILSIAAGAGGGGGGNIAAQQQAPNYSAYGSSFGAGTSNMMGGFSF